ncbi:MAG: cobamide remodeling phosphodiesterase CbiR [Syntrophobacteraceae bacterium]
MRILLLEHPRKFSQAHFNDIANTPLWSCLMTGYAAAALVCAGFEADIFDAARFGFEQTLGRLTQSPQPDFLAVHAVYSWESTEALFRMLSKLRALGFDAPICLYGFFPGLVCKEVLDYCDAVDFVVVGEPEQTIVELAKQIEKEKSGNLFGSAPGVKGIAFRVNGKAVFTGARSPLQCPDALPFPLRPSLDNEDTVSLLASRGCYNNCSFCLISALDFGRSTWRGRSTENIVAEISHLVGLGKRDFYFVDPNFVGPGKAGVQRAVDLARELEGLNITFGMETRANDVTPALMKELVRGGLNRLLLGLESARPEVLKRLGKHTSAGANEGAVAAVREAGIEPEIGFIMFDAQSSVEDIRMNLAFLERNQLLDRLGRTANLLCHDFIALKGTTGYRKALDKNLLEPQGLFGFEGRLLFSYPRTGWLAGVVKKICLFVLMEMGKPFSPIHWSGDRADTQPYRAVNDLLVDSFKRLLEVARQSGSLPDQQRTEELLFQVQAELKSAFNLPQKSSEPAQSVSASSPLCVEKGFKTTQRYLPKLKGSFPFRLATTSYIIQDAVLPNVMFLGKYFDEIELVLFESRREDNLPTVREVQEMARVARDLDFSYNVHLPSDLFFADPDRCVRQKYCETALSFYERTLPLAPSGYVLHLDAGTSRGTVEPDVNAWVDRARECLRFMEARGMDLRRTAVENLDYPLERLSPFIQDFDLSVCLDFGHLLRCGYDIASQAALFCDRIAMAHLHGVDKGKDHKGINHIADAHWITIGNFLEGYSGTLSLEVFSLDDLAASCDRMVDLCPRVLPVEGSKPRKEKRA